MNRLAFVPRIAGSMAMGAVFWALAFGGVARGDAVASIEAFVEQRDAESWSRVEKEVRAQPDSTLAHFLAFHEARLQRDLPNSMARVGESPTEAAARAGRAADVALGAIGTRLGDIWPVISALASQSFDDDLVFSAAEAAARLAPDRFDSLRSHALGQRAESREIFDRVRERWLAKPVEG